MPTVRDWATTDFYAILGVEPGADAATITSTYRARAKRLHPDTESGDVEEFQTLADAYRVLGDADLRQRYDELRAGLVATPAAVRAAPTAPFGRVPPPMRRRRLVIGGIVSMVAGLLAIAGTVALVAHDGRVRAEREGATATVIAVRPQPAIRFVTSDGERVVTDPPERKGAGTLAPGDSISIRYRPTDPTDVVSDESTLARNLTFVIVAAKLLVGGAVLVYFGRRGTSDSPRRTTAA